MSFEAALDPAGVGELRARWRGRARFVLLGAGADVALDFLGVWRAWLDDPDRCEALWFIALGWADSGPRIGSCQGDAATAPPLGPASLLRPGSSLDPGSSVGSRSSADAGSGVESASPLDSGSSPDAPVTVEDASLRMLMRRVRETMPPLTANLHRLAFDAGRVQLLLTTDAPEHALRDLTAEVDAFRFDLGLNAIGDAVTTTPRAGAEVARRGDTTPLPFLERAPRGTASLARLAAPRATLVSPPLSDVARRALTSAGFDLAASPSKPPCASPRLAAVFRPRVAPRRDARRGAVCDDAAAPVVIVGAGLAGCAAAWALAEQGRTSVVVERRPVIADEASGNPAGLFHGIVNGHDGTHARFHRAAALEAEAAARIAIERHGAHGQVGGLLQLVDAGESVASMRGLVARLRLPDGYVRALDADEAAAASGLAPSRPGWLFPGGGWIAPRDLARAFLARAGTKAEVRLGVEVDSLRRDGSAWTLLDRAGRTLLRGAVVVLANAGEALRLAGGGFPVEPVRGQLSRLPLGRMAARRLPRLPVSGAGYLLPAVDGHAVFGATAQRGDADTSLRLEDDRKNLLQLQRLAPESGIGVDALPRVMGRAAVRWSARDRLPLIGAVPRLGDAATGLDGYRPPRFDQPRFVARERGLFLFAGLGSRGLTWAALGAQVLASSITGAPMAVESSLLDALDPARFAVRARRRAPA